MPVESTEVSSNLYGLKAACPRLLGFVSHVQSRYGRQTSQALDQLRTRLFKLSPGDPRFSTGEFQGWIHVAVLEWSAGQPAVAIETLEMALDRNGLERDRIHDRAFKLAAWIALSSESPWRALYFLERREATVKSADFEADWLRAQALERISESVGDISVDALFAYREAGEHARTPLQKEIVAQKIKELSAQGKRVIDNGRTGSERQWTDEEARRELRSALWVIDTALSTGDVTENDLYAALYRVEIGLDTLLASGRGEVLLPVYYEIHSCLFPGPVPPRHLIAFTRWLERESDRLSRLVDHVSSVKESKVIGWVLKLDLILLYAEQGRRAELVGLLFEVADRPDEFLMELWGSSLVEVILPTLLNYQLQREFGLSIDLLDAQGFEWIVPRAYLPAYYEIRGRHLTLR